MEKKEYLKAPFKPKQNESVKRSEPSGGKIIPENRSRRYYRRWIDYLINKICG
jgi:hypothetical protein